MSGSSRVKVCDICGHPGFEDCLAHCSLCSDRTQHSYCMYTLLDTVPLDWVCEVCKCKVKEGRSKKGQVLTHMSSSGVLVNKTDHGMAPNSHLKPCDATDMVLSRRSARKGGNVLSWKRSKLSIPNYLATKKSFNLSVSRTGVTITATDITTEEEFQSQHVPVPSRSKVNVYADVFMAGLFKPSSTSSMQCLPSSAKPTSSCNSNLRCKSERAEPASPMNQFKVEPNHKDCKVPIARLAAEPGTQGAFLDIKSNPSFYHSLLKSNSIKAEEEVFPLLLPSSLEMPAKTSDAYGHLSDRVGSVKETMLANGNNPMECTRERLVVCCQPLGAQKCMPEVMSASSGRVAEKGSLTSSSLCRHQDDAVNVDVKNMCYSATLESKTNTVMEAPKISIKREQSLDCNNHLMEDKDSMDLCKHSKLMHFQFEGNTRSNNRQPHEKCQQSGAQSLVAESMHVLHRQPPLQVHAVPDVHIAWSGCFNVFSSAPNPTYYNKMQAHASNLADPKVHYAAEKLPAQLQLDELQRGVNNGLWPISFKEFPPDSRSIGIYFFPVDMDSHVMWYKPLLDRMVARDLVLRASLEFGQLLVFPSKLLSERDQRWDDMEYLWGVFQSKKQKLSLEARRAYRGSLLMVQHSPVQVDENVGNGLISPVADGCGKVIDMQIRSA